MLTDRDMTGTDDGFTTREIFDFLSSKTPPGHFRKLSPKLFITITASRLSLKTPHDIFDIGCSPNSPEFKENYKAFIDFAFKKFGKEDKTYLQIRVTLGGLLQAISLEFESEFAHALEDSINSIASDDKATKPSLTTAADLKESPVSIKKAEKLEEDTFINVLKHFVKLKISNAPFLKIYQTGFTPVLHNILGRLDKNKKKYKVASKPTHHGAATDSVPTTSLSKRQAKLKTKLAAKKTLEFKTEITDAKKQEFANVTLEEAVKHPEELSDIFSCQKKSNHHPACILMSWTSLTSNSEYLKAKNYLHDIFTDRNFVNIKNKFYDVIIENLGSARLKTQYLLSLKASSSDQRPGFKLSTAQLVSNYQAFKKKSAQKQKLPEHLDNLTADTLMDADIHMIIDLLSDHNHLNLLELSKKRCERYVLTELPVIIAKCFEAKLRYENSETAGAIYNFGYPITPDTVGEALFKFIMIDLLPVIPGLANCDKYFKVIDTRKLMKKFTHSPAAHAYFESSLLDWPMSFQPKSSPTPCASAVHKLKSSPDQSSHSESESLYVGRLSLYALPPSPITVKYADSEQEEESRFGYESS